MDKWIAEGTSNLLGLHVFTRGSGEPGYANRNGSQDPVVELLSLITELPR
jgi:hypothetical protein